MAMDQINQHKCSLQLYSDNNTYWENSSKVGDGMEDIRYSLRLLLPINK